MNKPLFANNHFSVSVEGSPDCLWKYQVAGGGPVFRIAPPVFEIDGKPVPAVLAGEPVPGAERRLRNGCMEASFSGLLASDPDLVLEAVFRLGKSPFIRFHYLLRCASGRKLTKASGRDSLRYLGVDLAPLADFTEIRLSEFNQVVHGFCPSERKLEGRHFEGHSRVMGPILAGEGGGVAALLAYEHGSQVPDAFVEFGLSPSRKAEIRAVKGNYWAGQGLLPESPFETLWLEFGAVSGGQNELARQYRDFILKEMTENLESRRPYIFYNTWGYQERNKNWNGKTFLESMNQEHIMREIDIAYRLGIEVYVIDTGWYEKTGDWRVSRKRFPDGLKSVREKLEGYGMRMGLWFNPCVAALTSEMHRNHRDCLQTLGGKPHPPGPVWETEDSQGICLVSRYSRAFSDELIRLYHELGVSYFKWDAIAQYGCDDPGHWHGTHLNTGEERADCYAFLQAREMAGVVDRVCAACPSAIVDFDITEAGRSVGLEFLSAAKYFLQNNGPYFHTYDLPGDPAKDMWNLFMHPGPTRAWMCRYPYDYDRWIPSILTMTHYLVDDPRDSQLINIASTVLGHNGAWGDLTKVSEAGIALWSEALTAYKQVRDDITSAYPVRDGGIGGSPEVHEKVSGDTGRGVVCMFSTEAGEYEYLTANRVAPPSWQSEGVVVEEAGNGLVRLRARFDKPSARIVFFGK
jgi:alpha-galactosidase